ncbi:hypothetical protein DFH09DRAFT_1411321 [Mycena vulgaris]|nr:hypothetical protein DFH09DRAFT_1411321 [Mycena vulgaris]
MLTLPVEVTVEVFLRCLHVPNRKPADYHNHCSPHEYTNPSPLDAPLIFLQVCHDWRAIALGTLKLWATLQISDCSPCGKTKLGRAMLIHKKTKAGAMPLHNSCPAHPGGPEISQDLPMHAQHLRIHAREEFCRAKDNSITSFEVAPNLTAVELWHLAPSRVRLPSQQLTRFSADRLFTADCLHVLRMASSLIDCALISISDRVGGATISAPEDSYQIHVHSTLRSLKLAGEFEMCGKLLPYLTLPALTSLAIWVGGDVETDHFVSFLSRSRVELQHLDLYCVYYSFDSALPFMASLSVKQ